MVRLSYCTHRPGHRPGETMMYQACYKYANKAEAMAVLDSLALDGFVVDFYAIRDIIPEGQE